MLTISRLQQKKKRILTLAGCHLDKTFLSDVVQVIISEPCLVCVLEFPVGFEVSTP